MPHYYFDTDDQDFLHNDDDGVELTSDAAASAIAQRALSEMARDRLPDGNPRTFLASVRNEAGKVIYRATLTLKGEWIKQTEF